MSWCARPIAALGSSLLHVQCILWPDIEHVQLSQKDVVLNKYCVFIEICVL